MNRLMAMMLSLTLMATTVVAVSAATGWQAKVDDSVLRAVTLGKADFIVYLAAKADLSLAERLPTKRAKGTAAVLEQLARDVTGWPAKAVEFFQLLATTQHLNHVRLDNLATVSLRDANQLELVNSPFERATHTVDVRHIDNGRGKYNIPNIGIFLWRLQSYFIMRSTARAASDPPDGRYTFNPLGYSVPLFNRPRTETEITQLAVALASRRSPERTASSK
jgi:hypothetical protein